MKITTIKRIAFTLIFLFSAGFSFAQMTSPQDPGGGPSGGDPPIGGGAPLSGGIVILITLGAAYGGSKVYKLTKKHSSDD